MRGLKEIIPEIHPIIDLSSDEIEILADKALAYSKKMETGEIKVDKGTGSLAQEIAYQTALFIHEEKMKIALKEDKS